MPDKHQSPAKNSHNSDIYSHKTTDEDLEEAAHKRREFMTQIIDSEMASFPNTDR